MANVLVQESSLEAIADAIRGQNGTQNTYKPSEMAGAIEQISGGGIIPSGTKKISANGTYNVSEFESAEVSVPQNGIVPTGVKQIRISENKTTVENVSEYAYVSIYPNVPNSYAPIDEGKVVENGELIYQGSDIFTENGTYDTTNVSEVTVNVSEGGGGGDGGITPVGTIQITENGIVDVTNYASAEVDVPQSGIVPAGTLQITQNGTVDVTNYASAEVNVPTGGGGEADLGTKTITENGTYNASSDSLDGYSQVIVDVEANLDSKIINANGMYDSFDDGLDGYTYVDVNVPNSYTSSDEGKVVENGALVAQTSRNIDTNGTYDTTLNNEVVVNVSGSCAEEAPFNDVCFWDYDGTCLYSYTADEFANLSALPANPSHTGLTAQGWNWTLADAKEFVSANGFLDIGQLYVTDDGKTRIHVSLRETSSIKISLIGSAAGNLTIDWGDGSATETNTGTSATTYEHSYTSGDFTISITVSSGTLTLNGLGGSGRSAFREINIGSNVKLNGSCFSTAMNLSRVSMPLDCNVSAFGGSNIGIKCLILPSDVFTTERAYSNTLTEVICFAKQTRIYGAYGQFAQNRGLRRLSASIGRSGAGWQVQTLIENLSLERFLITDGLTGFSNLNSTQNLYSLKKVTIPASVTTIPSGSFSNVYSLKEVHMLATTPPTLGGTNVWSNRPSEFRIYVPYSEDHSILAAYQAASNWSNYASVMVEEEA